MLPILPAVCRAGAGWLWPEPGTRSDLSMVHLVVDHYRVPYKKYVTGLFITGYGIRTAELPGAGPGIPGAVPVTIAVCYLVSGWLVLGTDAGSGTGFVSLQPELFCLRWAGCSCVYTAMLRFCAAVIRYDRNHILLSVSRTRSNRILGFLLKHLLQVLAVVVCPCKARDARGARA